MMLINNFGPLFYLLFSLRLLTVLISSRNEKKLKALGAVEFGKHNSRFLIIGHFIFYISCLVEGYLKFAFFQDTVAFTGFFLYLFSILMLFYVIFSIRDVWTVKLIIGPQEYHKINNQWLFRVFKHPNYFLNILPELTGLALLFHAWFSLVIGLPIYIIVLFKRIRLEERMMRHFFEDYR
jgi:isoprenylcysteine carboxyl methyltransferase (ICMT) family protein YpbQ